MSNTADEAPILNILKLKVPDLKRELKNRSLSTSGNKNELIERLQTALETPKVDPLIDEDIEEDLLNDDDDDHIDERESLINDLDNDLDDFDKGTKRKLDNDIADTTIMNPVNKRVILKRNHTNEASLLLSSANNKLLENNVTTTEESKSEEKKVIKLSELSMKERLELRAKKFGVTNFSDDTKKLARAERFGSISSSNNNSADSIKANSSTANIDVLKQRAERFGSSVSTVMSKIDNEERKNKRKERFGLTIAKNSNSDAAKAARLERFKITAVK